MGDNTLSTKQIEDQWKSAFSLVQNFTFKQDLSDLTHASVQELSIKYKTLAPVYLYQVKRLVYNPDEGIIDKLVNIYSSLYSLNASVFVILRGNKDGTTDYFVGCRARGNNDTVKTMLPKSFEGNFPGIELSFLKQMEKKELMDNAFPDVYKRKNVAALSVSPDFRKIRTEENGSYIQGVEKFIDTMKGQEYTALILSEPISRQDIQDKRAAYESLLTELSKYNKISFSYNESSSLSVNESLAQGTNTAINESINHSTSTNTSQSVGKTKGRNHGHGMGFFGFSSNSGHATGKTTTNTSGESSSDSYGKTSTSGESRTETRGTTDTKNQGRTFSINIENKSISRLVERIEYELQKLDHADSYGLWDSAIYFVSEEKETCLIGASSLRSLVVGDKSGNAETFINHWDNSSDTFSIDVEKLMTFLHYGTHPVFSRETYGNHDYLFTPAISIGGDVLPSVMGLPLKSVPGITVVETPEFGRNIVTDDLVKSGNRKIRLGEVVFMGKNDSTPVYLSVNSLASHTFVCGAPGSGKSNTVYKLINELSQIKDDDDADENGKIYKKVKFLIVEPAKGEYKYEFGNFPGVNIYTTQNNVAELLRINPFEFPYQKMSISEHIDRLKNIITACWSLTAAMPAILTDALETAYLRTGWDLKNSLYVLPGDVRFPSFQDVMNVLPELINNLDYSSDTKGDYIGALVTRVSSMTKGIVGNIFCENKGVPDSKLFDENTIIDLSNVGSNEVRSLIMGVIVMKLENYRKTTALCSNYPLRHITVLEEAHNLLPRCSKSQNEESSNVQGKAVEMISHAISEMRTYGEGFIIVDQTPQNVDSVAISNTSTKIIMRLADEEDIKVAASSIGLDEKQKKLIPMLPQGQGIIKQGNWIAPIVARIDKSQSLYKRSEMKTFDYADIKMFREALIKRIDQIVNDTEKDAIIDAVRVSSVSKYISGSKGIPANERTKYIEIWEEFASFDPERRQREYPRLLVKILNCEDVLIICEPHLKEKPTDLKNPTGEFLKSLKDWSSRMMSILPHYTTGNTHFIKFIETQIYRYCESFGNSKISKLCSSAILGMRK